VTTGRKYLRGPRGTGFLYVPESITKTLWPHHVDHYSVPVMSVPDFLDTAMPVQDVLEIAPRPGAARFEFWESSIGSKLGLGEAIRLALELGATGITNPIFSDLALYLYGKLERMDGVHLHYKPECGIITFWVKGMDSTEIMRMLERPSGESGVVFEVSVVPATSTPLDSASAGVPDLVRASVSYTNTLEEIDLFIERLSTALQEFF
jgi:cysteine desulfurase / selenocysteine lyase